MKVELQVHLARDAETGRWYVAETDIPGLRLEAESAASLIQKIECAAPEMIELNSGEILERYFRERRIGKTSQVSPAWSYRPVFDSSFEAAYA